MCVLAPTLARLYLYLRRQQAGSTEGGINSRQFQLQLLAGWAYLLPPSLHAGRGAVRAMRTQWASSGEAEKDEENCCGSTKRERERGRAEGGEGGEIE